MLDRLRAVFVDTVIESPSEVVEVSKLGQTINIEHNCSLPAFSGCLVRTKNMGTRIGKDGF